MICRSAPAGMSESDFAVRKATNPFLRWDVPEVQQAEHGSQVATEVQELCSVNVFVIYLSHLITVFTFLFMDVYASIEHQPSTWALNWETTEDSGWMNCKTSLGSGKMVLKDGFPMEIGAFGLI